MADLDLNNLFGTLPPPLFSTLFCLRMREREDLRNVVSTRQAIAITKMLVATCFRKASTNLNPDDYIRSAVMTTAPEDQEIAEEVALAILFPGLKQRQDESNTQTSDRKKDKKGNPPPNVIPPPETAAGFSQEVLDGVSSFLNEMSSDFADIGSQVTPSVPVKPHAPDELDFFLESIRKAQAGIQPFKSLLNALDSPSEILYKKLVSLAQLAEFVSQQLLASINNLDGAGLAAIPHSTVTQKILDDSSNAVEKAVAQRALGLNDQFDKSIRNLMGTSPVDVARVARSILDAGAIKQEEFQTIVQQAAAIVTTSSDIYNVIKIAQNLTPNVKESLFKIIEEESSLVKALEITQSLENMASISQPLTVDFLNRVLSSPELGKKLSYPALPHIPFYNKEIEKAMMDSFQKDRNQLQEGNQVPDFQSLYDEIADVRERTGNPYYLKMLKQMAEMAGNDWMLAITAKQNFLNTGHQLASQGVQFDKDQILEHGLKIGCRNEEINEILYSTFELFLKSIEEGTKDVHGYTSVLKRLKPAPDQMKRAMSTAFSKGNRDAIAAMAGADLGQICQLPGIAGNSPMEDLLVASLSAGSGEDLLKQWFICRDRIPSSLREKMKRVLKNIVIATAMDMARMKLGSAESGLLASNQTRIYRDGDDFDQLDVEGTLDNLVSMGKPINQILPDDLSVYDLKKGRVAICILVDVSGSMSAVERLSYCALLVTMLISRLKEQEIAIALFESNTHVIMEFEEEKPEIEHIIDELLDIRAMGGTVVNQALHWSYEQFQKVKAERLYFVVASDFEFYHEVANEVDFKGIQKKKPKTYLISPASGINSREIIEWQKVLNAATIRLKSEKDIIDTVCKIISNR